MQINRNYISIKFYNQMYEKEINFVALREFEKLHVYFTRREIEFKILVF